MPLQYMLVQYMLVHILLVHCSAAQFTVYSLAVAAEGRHPVPPLIESLYSTSTSCSQRPPHCSLVVSSVLTTSPASIRFTEVELGGGHPFMCWPVINLASLSGAAGYSSSRGTGLDCALLRGEHLTLYHTERYTASHCT